MALKAKDIVEKIKVNEAKFLELSTANAQKAAKDLRIRCKNSMLSMVDRGEYSTEVGIFSIDEQLYIPELTEKLRENGYKFCLIEIQNENEEVIRTKLRISVEHLA